nr:hypothetical protein [Clostridia bacterium]
SLINNNYLYDIADLTYMDLSQPYYDSNVVESFTLGGKTLMVTGDLLIMDNEATWVVLFNKKLANDYGFADKYGTDLYGLVNNGKFTLDVFHETAAMAAVDLDGDGEMTHTKDQWGFQTETANHVMMLYGCGEQTIRFDNDGYPVIALEGDRIASAVEKIYEIQNADYAINASTISSQYSDVWGEVIDKNYIEGRALYNIAGMNRVTIFRTMDVDFGILPLPKYDEAQDEYFCPVSFYGANFMSFPATLTDPDRTGIIVEALSCESMYTLTPAYYDVTISGKALRDEESLEMLDIIFANRVWDLGYAFSWGGITNVVNDASTFASQLASVTPTVEAAIKTTMDVITGN